MEEAIGRYLGVFLPFVATLVCAHFIVRQSSNELFQRMSLADPRMFRRVLIGTGVAVGLIVAVDMATGGDLFLRPRFPESELLITFLLVVVLLAMTLGRSLEPIARRFKRSV